jgi:hypothetical protein
MSAGVSQGAIAAAGAYEFPDQAGERFGDGERLDAEGEREAVGPVVDLVRGQLGDPADGCP